MSKNSYKKWTHLFPSLLTQETIRDFLAFVNKELFLSSDPKVVDAAPSGRAMSLQGPFLSRNVIFVTDKACQQHQREEPLLFALGNCNRRHTKKDWGKGEKGSKGEDGGEEERKEEKEGEERRRR